MEAFEKAIFENQLGIRENLELLEKGNKALPDGTMKKYANGWYRKEAGKWVYQKGFKGPANAAPGTVLTPDQHEHHLSLESAAKADKSAKPAVPAPAAKAEAKPAPEDAVDQEAHDHFADQISPDADDADVSDIARMLARQKAKGKLTPVQQKLYDHVQGLIQTHKPALAHHMGTSATPAEKVAPAAEKEVEKAPEPAKQPEAKAKEPKEAPKAAEPEEEQQPTPEEAKAEVAAVEAVIEEFNKADENTTFNAATDPEEIAATIKALTPETRDLVGKKLNGYDPKEADKAQVEAYKDNAALAFTPSDVELPLGLSGQQITAADYTKVKGLDIMLIDEKNILTAPKPAYIPDVDPKMFKHLKYSIQHTRLPNGNYLAYFGDYSNKDKSGKWAVLSPDLLVATMNYHFGVAKAQAKLKHDADEEAWGKLHEEKGWGGGKEYKKKKFVFKGTLKPNKMTFGQYHLIQASEAVSGSTPVWNAYKSYQKELKQKAMDMEMQMQDLDSSYYKGKETSYGDSGTSDELKAEFGVKIKTQNGKPLTPEHVNQIETNLHNVYKAFGDLSSMSESWNLKISHSGDKLQHAKKALGIFHPAYHAIGVTGSWGDHSFGKILSHEYGHFMDHYVGGKQGHHYESSINGSKAHGIASKFRDLMEKTQDSDYQNRTCECFARAMEQYYVEKMGKGYDDYSAHFAQGNHPKPDVFKKDVMPLIDEWLAERQDLLKAGHAELTKNF